MNLYSTLLISSLLVLVSCDVPTNCMYADTVGKWILHLGPTNQTNKIDCAKTIPTLKTIKIQLLFPNTVVDEYGNEGTWTMIYNQGFEITLSGRRYFAFQYYKQTDPKTTVSYCNETFNGWVHDVVTDNVFPPKNWGCYYGQKLFSTSQPKVSEETLGEYNLNAPYRVNQKFVDKINYHQSSWKAGIYEEHLNFTIYDMIQRSGGQRRLPQVKPIKVTAEVKAEADALPEAYDWREKDFVSPVRDQGSCGSCYAFASMGVLEAGVRIGTNGRLQPVFSPQDVVSCSHYSQGCEGGFPYLIAGMYAQDYGVVSEESYPYLANDTKFCKPKEAPIRIHVSDYGYVGGFYGGCNEALMRVALVKIGPIAVAINVTADFMQYKGGIYHHTGFEGPLQYNPFQVTNHAVLVVGYGIDHDSGEKYWIVKNSWGTAWGEDGYFRIRRNTNEIAIESLAVYAKPYVGH